MMRRGQRIDIECRQVGLALRAGVPSPSAARCRQHGLHGIRRDDIAPHSTCRPRGYLPKATDWSVPAANIIVLRPPRWVGFPHESVGRDPCSRRTAANHRSERRASPCLATAILRT